MGVNCKQHFHCNSTVQNLCFKVSQHQLRRSNESLQLYFILLGAFLSIMKFHVQEAGGSKSFRLYRN